MVKVMFTVDVELWCNWDRLDEEFAENFKRYIYGPTPSGRYGLPMTLRMLDDYGLNGVFFTEALFAARFGLEPLTEIVTLIQDAGQEVQLHLHTEWLDEAREPILSGAVEKRQFIRQFDLEEQIVLVRAGASLLERAGAEQVTAFRAGSFGMGPATPQAVARSGLRFDSSYNEAKITAAEKPHPSMRLLQPMALDGVVEYPLSTFIDFTKRRRQLQLGSCSSQEIEQLLWHACENGWEYVVMLSHNFELLNQRKDRADPVVVGRFERLCRFLDRHRDAFRTVGFASADICPGGRQPAGMPLVSPGATLRRHAEQLWRRVYR